MLALAILGVSLISNLSCELRLFNCSIRTAIYAAISSSLSSYLRLRLKYSLLLIKRMYMW